MSPRTKITHVETLRFIIVTIPSIVGKFTVAVNDLVHMDDWEPNQWDGSICADEDNDLDSMLDIVNGFVWEHICILRSRQPNFFLGSSHLDIVPSVFPTHDSEDDLYYKVFKIVSGHFNKDYYENYKDEHLIDHCFTIDYEIKRDSVEIKSFKIDEKQH